MKLPIYLLLVVVTFASVAVGQSHKDKLEIGVHSTSLTVFDPDFVGDVTHGGIGGRITYNLNRSFAAEAEVNFFPQTRLFASAGGNSIQAQFGVKAGKRFEKFGIFAKLRPGFLNVDDVFSFLPAVINGTPTLDFKIERTTLFTLDIGGVLEFYPAKRIVVRFEAGDTVIRYPKKVDPIFGGQSLAFIDRPPKFKQNFQFTAGVGFRLGDFPAAEANVASSSSGGPERVPRYEIGAQFTSMFVDDPTNDCGFCLLRSPQNIHTEPGIGGRFTLNLTEKIAVEAEGNYYTRRLVDFPNPGGHMFQGQFGVKIGKRQENWGWFVKARPGFVGFTSVFELLGSGPFIPPLNGRFVKKHFPSVDLGGVLEFYLSRHWIARFDIGDTIIRYSAQRTLGFAQSMPVFTRPAETRHNLQVTSGIGFRF
jgi:hypothetical protein